MKDKILALLKTKYSGVQAVLLGLIAEKLTAKVTEESQIQGVVDELANLPISVEDFGKLLQTEGDKRATEAAKTREDKLKAEFELTPKGQPKPDPQPKPNDDAPAWAQSLIKQNEELALKLKSIESEKQQDGLRQKLMTKLTEKKIPAVFAEGLAIEKEEDIDTVVTGIETKYNSVRQHMINENLVAEVPTGSVNKDGVSTEVAEFIKSKTPQADGTIPVSDLGGKKL